MSWTNKEKETAIQIHKKGKTLDSRKGAIFVLGKYVPETSAQILLNDGFAPAWCDGKKGIKTRSGRGKRSIYPPPIHTLNVKGATPPPPFLQATL